MLPSAAEAAAAILAPIVDDVARYIAGEVDTKPQSLLVLPDTLQSRAELERAKRRPPPRDESGVG